MFPLSRWTLFVPLAFSSPSEWVRRTRGIKSRLMRTLSLGLAAAIAAGAVLVAIPGRAQAQVGISVGFGSGSFYDPAYDDEFGWSPRYQPQNVYGYNSPVAYGYGTRVGYGYGSPYTAQPVVTTRRVVVRDTYRPRRVVVREVYEPRRVVVRRDYVAPRRVVTRTYGPAPVVRVRHY